MPGTKCDFCAWYNSTILYQVQNATDVPGTNPIGFPHKKRITNIT
ncbi:hypothetical protein AAEO50_01420 [Rossellomorea oryzaecorticis]|uniref:Uncharacterized protein n=1 Tax=Rossellomorea oryzaecorticis TaxID=1396505 RepID=A0ABU9K6P3_9BACI